MISCGPLASCGPKWLRRLPSGWIHGISRKTELGQIEDGPRPYASFDMGSGVKIAVVFGGTSSGA